MTKKSGKVYDRVAELLNSMGVIDTSTLEVATLSRGCDHLVCLCGEVAGEYNHKADRLVIYP